MNVTFRLQKGIGESAEILRLDLQEVPSAFQTVTFDCFAGRFQVVSVQRDYATKCGGGPTESAVVYLQQHEQTGSATRTEG